MSYGQLQLRRDSAADWTSANPTLAQGEIGWEVDTTKFKIGDGSTAWVSLAYWGVLIWQPLDATLTALAAFNTNGLLTQTAADTFAGRTLTAPAAGFTITNPAGVAGNPTFVLANDLAALEGLGSTGLAARTGSDTWAQRTIAGTSNEVSVANGSGAAGDPTISLPSALTFSGKTVTGGSITPEATPTTTAIGYLGSPQISDQDDYTLVMADAGKHYYHVSGSTHTLTIPANGSVAFPIGTIIAGVNESGAGALTIAITTDTLRWGSSTGSRTIAANGAFSLMKVASTTWRLTGEGIS